MRKTLIAALVIAGATGQVVAQHVKEATLKFALTHQFQSEVYVDGFLADGIANADKNLQPTWQWALEGGHKITYVSSDKSTKFGTAYKTKKIDSAYIIKSLGVALNVSFPTKATLVVYKYANLYDLPPYPTLPGWMYNPTVADVPGGFAWSYPYPTESIFAWPSENSIRWNYVWYNGENEASLAAQDIQHWVGVYVKWFDSNNNPHCVNVTPFFAFEEGYCNFCWDTVDRVTDGTISTTTANPAPCVLGGGRTGITGNGTTKWYQTIKFDNTRLNASLLQNNLVQYYQDAYLLDLVPLPYTPGPKSVLNALRMTVSGVATYKWQFKNLDQGLVAVMGTINVDKAGGYGGSPFCGVYTGTFSIAEASILEADQISTPCGLVAPIWNSGLLTNP
jgi:hypothetical protein